MTDTRRAFALGLVGWPVGHSVSPAMHRAALRSAGLEGCYDALPAPDVGALDLYLGRLREGSLHGLNVTLPWKLEAFARCEVLTDTARAAGAVNTVRALPGGRLEGDNTDVPGLVAAVLEAFPGLEPGGRPVAIIGAGGAARASVLAALRLGAGEVRVYNRTPARASRLVAELGHGAAVETLAEALSGAALVLQASSLGLGLSPDASRDAARTLVEALSGLSAGAAIVDLVYGPHATPWALAAALTGHAAVDGLGMLVHQAALAFEWWTGHPGDVAAMRAAALSALADRAG